MGMGGSKPVPGDSARHSVDSQRLIIVFSYSQSLVFNLEIVLGDFQDIFYKKYSKKLGTIPKIIGDESEHQDTVNCPPPSPPLSGVLFQIAIALVGLFFQHNAAV